MRDGVAQEIRQMIRDGILVISEHTDWASPLVIAKKDGTFQIFGDFRNLNRCIQSDKYPLPGVEDLLARLDTGNKYFAKLDLEAAYHQIPLAMDSKPLTTVVTPHRDIYVH